MGSTALPSPAFGKADLSNCEREQIHLAGSIQPFGALLLVGEPDLTIVMHSANAPDILGLPEPLLGQALADLPGDLLDGLRPLLDEPLDAVPVALRSRMGMPATDFDVLVHRPPGGGLAIEFERAGRKIDLSHEVQAGLAGLVACASLETLGDDAASLFRDITGYDRVMVYRFDAQGHGQVLSENKRADLEPFLGNWYPASDIPQIARKLYERNRVRVLADAGHDPVPLVPRLSPLTGRDLDMSLCFLRSMSPLHVQYLKNMGVAATLVVSIMVGSKLWGLVACHHYAPRVVHFEVRSVCELLAEVVATRNVALDAFVQTRSELAVRHLERRMVEAIATEGDWRTALFDRSQSLLTILRAQGAALLLDDEIMTMGDAPDTQTLRQIRSWLETRPQESLTLSDAVAEEVPELAPSMPETGGLLAVPISRSRTDYLVWFRPERIRTVTWGGDPTKPFVVGTSPLDLSPRRSFAQWHELVEGTCEAWSPADQASARMIGDMVTDVVLQFRAVRMLIVQDQLAKVGRQVTLAEQPVVIADAQGQVTMTNGAFALLLNGSEPPTSLGDLANLFEGRAAVEQHIRDLTRRKRSWRGEVMCRADGKDVPLLVRGDPVLAAPGRVLGFVLLFLDVSDRRAAEQARSRFLDKVVAPHAFAAARITAATDPRFHDLLSAVVENAQVAALEITDGPDLAQAPGKLDAIQASVDRAATVLEQLVWHATRIPGEDA